MSQLSQQSVLQKVKNWSEKECKDNFEDVMPKILLLIIDASSNEMLQLCSILHDKFLCHVLIDELGRKILNTVGSELARVFYENLENLPSSHQSVATMSVSDISKLLKYLVEILKCYDELVRHIVSLVKSSVHNLDLLYISDFLNNTIEVLNKSYLHCKNSEKDYGQLFQTINGLLGVLFKKTYAMQKGFGFIVANVKQTPKVLPSDEIRTAVEKICQGLLSVCETTCTVDNTLLISTWSIVVKFMKEFKDVVQDEISPDPYISLLCGNIAKCVGYSIKLHDQSNHLICSGDEATKKALEQSLKFSKILMSNLNELMTVFDAVFHDGLCSALLSFLHGFHKLFMLKLFCKDLDNANIKFRRKILEEHLGNYESVTAMIVRNSQFLQYLRSVSSNDIQRSPDYGWLHVWVSCMKVLLNRESLLSQWCEVSATDKTPVVLLLQLVTDCVGSIDNTIQSHFNWSSCVYDMTLTTVCALISELPREIFIRAEEDIFQMIFSCSPIKGVFAGDVFTFLARSSPSMARRYRLTFCSVLCSMVNANIQKITFSMLTLISISSRIGVSSKEVIKTLSSHSSTFPGWFILLGHEDRDVSDMSCGSIVSRVENILKRSEIKICHIHNLVDCMVQFRVTLKNLTAARGGASRLKSCLLSVINIFIDFQSSNSTLLHSISYNDFISHFLTALTPFVPFLSNSEKGEVLECFKPVLCSNVILPVKLKIIDVLSKLGSVPSENSEAASTIFQRLISDENWMVRHFTVTALITITENMSDNTLLGKCTSNDEILKTIESDVAFDPEKFVMYHASLVKPDSICATELEKCMQSWRDHYYKKPDGASTMGSLTMNHGGLSQCILQIKNDLLALSEMVTQEKIDMADVNATDLQNLSSIKSMMNRFFKFDL